MTTNIFRKRFMEAAFGSAASWGGYLAGFVLNGAGLNQRSTYADVSSRIDPAIPLKSITSWTFVPESGGVAPHMKIVTPPTWTNASGGDVGPFQYFAVIGTFSGSNELLWFQLLDPIVTVPAGDTLCVPGGIIVRARGL